MFGSVILRMYILGCNIRITTIQTEFILKNDFTYPTVKDLVLGNFLSFPLRGELDDDKPSEMFSSEFEEIFFSRV